MTKVAPSPKRKALSINLDSNIYGTFSEIGAGQEVVRHFFRAGGASGTIAKAMSAYDKDFSDAIYGKEKTQQYVCKSRLKTMISHEYNLMEERLDRKNHANTKFFSFADTVATISYDKSNKGHGWMGMRYQLDPESSPNDLVLHFNLKDNESSLYFGYRPVKIYVYLNCNGECARCCRSTLTGFDLIANSCEYIRQSQYAHDFFVSGHKQ